MEKVERNNEIVNLYKTKYITFSKISSMYDISLERVRQIVKKNLGQKYINKKKLENFKYFREN